MQCLDFGDVLTYSSLQLHLTLSGVVCYCDVVLKYINITKREAENKAYQEKGQILKEHHNMALDDIAYNL